MNNFNKIKKVIKSNKLNYCIITFVLFFTLIGMLFYKVSILDLIKYLGFQLFYVLIPGSFIFRIVRMKEQYIEKFIFSYAIGVIFIIFQYFLCYSMNLKSLLYLIGPIASIIELVLYNFYNTNKNKSDSYKTDVQVITIFSIIFFITFIGFTLTNPLPDLIGKSSYNQDLLWLIGNTQGLLRGFQPTDTRLSYVPFKYHYFLSVYLAVISYVTKIDSVKLFFQFSQIGNVFLCVYSSFLLGKTYFKSSEKGVIFYIMLFFFKLCE